MRNGSCEQVKAYKNPSMTKIKINSHFEGWGDNM